MTRARALATMVLTASLVVGFAACALDEAGTSSDAGLEDVTIDVTIDQSADVSVDVTIDTTVDSPITNDAAMDAGTDALDATLDASDANDSGICAIDASCLSAFPADAGWTLVGLSIDASACAFSSGSLVTDPELAPDACACGCNTMGTASCGAANFGAFNDPSCSSLAVDGSVTGSACVDVGDLVPDAGMIVAPPTATGVVCSSSVVGTKGVTSTPLATCEPTACTNDFCGMKKTGYRLCIAHSGSASCPTGFPIEIDAFSSATGATCTGCGSCSLTNTQCTGKVATYGEGGCDGGSNNSFVGGPSCVPITNETLSISYSPDAPPKIGCTTSTLGGTVNTVGPVTLCCAP